MKKTLLLLFAALVASIGCIRAEIISRVLIDEIYYNLDTETKTAEVTYDDRGHQVNYKRHIETADIPASIVYDDVTYAVTSIGTRAFQSCSDLTTVTIPEGVTSIGSHAFWLCSHLTTVTLPDGLQTIDQYAFSDCDLNAIEFPNTLTSLGFLSFGYNRHLTSIDIPSSVVTIKVSCFSCCLSLVSFNVDPANPNYCDVDGVLFDKAMTRLIQYPAAKPGTEYVVPATVSTIAADAFSVCCNLTSIILHDGITKIMDSAFSSCDNLVSITIPESITELSSGILAGCDNLVSVSLPNSLTTIGDGAFGSCPSLYKITIPAKVETIGNGAFYFCQNLSYIICLAANPPSTGEYVFDYVNCDEVTLYVPKGSLELYQNAPIWQEFNPILPIEDMPDKKVWPIVMDNVTFEQEKDFVAGDLRENGVDNMLYIWMDTYSAGDRSGLNFYGNSEGYVSLVVGNQGWSGAGFCINNATSIAAIEELQQAIIADPDDYFLHLAIQSITEAGNHQFYTFGTASTSFAIGKTTIEQGEVIGDFSRDGHWYEFYVPLNQFAIAIGNAPISAGINILSFLSGSTTGAELKLDAIYFCNTAYKDNIDPVDDPTTIESVQSSSVNTQKNLRDGQILILHNGKTYTIMGAEVR